MARRAAIHGASLGLTILLGTLAALPPFGIDMALPALGRIGRDLAATPAVAALTLSVFLAAFGTAQLVLGPLSDRVGRRPVLLGGLALFAAGGLGCATAGSIGALLAWRLAQGTGAAAGSVMAFAVIRDLFEGDAARRQISYVATVLPLAPMIAPTVGGLMLLHVGWRGIYGLLAGGGLLLLGAVALCLPETHRPGGGGIGVWRGYGRVLRHRQAGGFALANALSFAMLFAWVSGSPLVLMGEAHISAPVYGGLFACISGGLLVGAWLSGWLAVRQVPLQVPVLGGLLGALACSSVALALVRAAPVDVATLVPALVLAMVCRALASPNMTHAALAPLPELAGVASAVIGFLPMAAGAAISALVAALYPALGATAVAGAMTVCALAALQVGRWAGRGYAAVPRVAEVLMDFSGKRVLVTGAGKGIGRAAATMLAARGAHVVALSRDPADLQSLAAETGCETIAVDLAELPGALDPVRAALPLDLLVNNAGITALESFLTTAQATFERVLRVNAQAPMLLMQMFAAELVARGGGGAVVNVSSNAAYLGIPDHAAYCASKAALDALTRVAAVELGRHAIRVNSVNPSVTLTPMGELAWSDPAKSGPVLARIPLGRFLQPEEVASAVCFLLSDEAAGITGTCLDVDHGFRAR